MTDPESDRALDPAAIEQLLEMTGGDVSFLDELLQSFLDGAAQQLADLRRGAAAGSAEEMVRPAHSLKGNSSNIGAARLVDLASRLEADSRTGSVSDAGARVEEVAAELEAVKAELGAIQGRA